MPSLPRVTVRDIAEKAGVHFTTVSLALRQSPRLKAATRERVLQIAESMGYRPDPMLAALNAYRKSCRPAHYQATIAWIHNWPSPEQLYRNGEFSQYYAGASERAQERGYMIEEFWLREAGMTVEKLHRILRARNIQGTLLAPQPLANIYLDLRYDELSAVAFGYTMQPAVLDLVSNHHVHTMKLLLQKVLELGYRRIGLVIPSEWDAKVEHAWQSGLLLLQAQRPDLARLPILWDIWDNEETKELEAWTKEHRPDVVISFHTTAHRLRSIGYRVPQDIGFACPFLDNNDYYLSGVHQNGRLIGRKAVDMVVDMIHRRETGIPETPVRVLVEGTWQPGKTLQRQEPASAKSERRKTGRIKKPKAVKSTGRKPPK
ncbi:LacI family transcriptional regulator [Spartobacteria bacterium LR76]|nr:LacI family transcriptional regulator [Spartobacteria bacterium LR76]